MPVGDQRLSRYLTNSEGYIVPLKKKWNPWRMNSEPQPPKLFSDKDKQEVAAAIVEQLPNNLRYDWMTDPLIICTINMDIMRIIIQVERKPGSDELTATISAIEMNNGVEKSKSPYQKHSKTIKLRNEVDYISAIKQWVIQELDWIDRPQRVSPGPTRGFHKRSERVNAHGKDGNPELW